MSLMLRLATALLLFTVVGAALAAGSAAAGQEKSAVCQGCHGPDGNSLGPEWPNLAGQGVRYLAKQIYDFQSGARQDPIMSAMVAGLGKDDIADIAAYFSSQRPGTNEDPREAQLIDSGAQLYRGGNSYSALPACASCHGPNAAGNGPAGFPRLAGQRVDYIIKALQDFRSGARANDPNSMMREIAARMTDGEIRAIAAYLATL